MLDWAQTSWPYLMIIYLLNWLHGSFKTDVLGFVDPLIGTKGGGHVFPGATLPYGMAKAGPDVNSNDNKAGFVTDRTQITGFSHLHDDGTGGSPSLGNFQLFPYAGCKGNKLQGCNFGHGPRATLPKEGSARAKPGYFSVILESGVRSEMTVTSHTALYRFTFPSQLEMNDTLLSPLILIDLNDLPNSRREGSVVVDPDSGRITGMGKFNPSFGLGDYKAYFCADFQGAGIKRTGVWRENKPLGKSKQKLQPQPYEEGGGFVQFFEPRKNREVLVRVGLSFLNEKKACRNAEKEIPNFDFRATVKAATQAWRQKLEVIQITPGGVDQGLETTFWSGIYRSLISPQDYTGENPLWKSQEPYFDSYYCIWDSYRSQHPLLTIVDPEAQTLMVRSLIDIYRHEGWLPDCRMSFDKGFTQGGSNADVVLVDSYLKGIKEKVDWNTGYKALIKDAEVEPPNWDVEGRGDLEPWRKKGYIPYNAVDTVGRGTHTRSVSRTVEYAYNDFCIAEMAKILGKKEDYAKYTNRSSNWENLYKSDQESIVNGKTYIGFLQPKGSNGSWGYQDPTLCAPYFKSNGCYLGYGGHETYEGSCWLYTFYVPGDMASLIKTLDGKEAFAERLDFFHENRLLDIGDEQGFLTVFQYHYAGRPGLSAKRAHAYIPSEFNTTLLGMPGNDDSGAMGSFASFCMMGFFPNPGQNVYFLIAPFFESVSIRNPQTGNVATIRNVNFDPSYEAIYIQSATLNGQPYTKNWFDHSFFLDGGTLELTLGTEESNWGSHKADLPPSLSTTGMHL